MGANGNRKPPRPRIEMAASTATPEEAAAVIAALERFLAETTPVPAAEETQSRWQRAGLIEGVTARRAALPPEPGSGLPFA
jgi:hypothetical protein